MNWRALAAALVCGLVVAAPEGRAAEYPARSIKLVVPYPAGGPTDVLGRMVGEYLSRDLKQSVVIENKGGAQGAIGAEAVAHAEADGYTLLFTASSVLELNPMLYKKLSYDPDRELRVLAIVTDTPAVMIVHPSVPAKSVAEFVAHARQNPGKLNCASAGIGTVPHLACEYLNKVAGTNILHVPYRDVNSAMVATVANVTQMFFGVSTSAKSQIESGAFRGLAVSTSQRSVLLPALPTMIESGYPTFNMPGWGGLLATAGTRKDIVEKLNAEVLRAVQRPETQKRLIAAGMEPAPPLDPGGFRAFIEDDIARWTQFVEAVGVERLKGPPQ